MADKIMVRDSRTPTDTQAHTSSLSLLSDWAVASAAPSMLSVPVSVPEAAYYKDG